MKFPFDEGKQRGARWNCNLVKRGKETCLSSLFLLFYREEYCMLVGERATGFFLLTEGFGSRKLLGKSSSTRKLFDWLWLVIFSPWPFLSRLFIRGKRHTISRFFSSTSRWNGIIIIRSDQHRCALSFFSPHHGPSPTNISRRAVCQVSIGASE